MKVMGTGSRSLVTRPDRMAVYENTEAYILSLREKYPDLYLISGMAEGWDEMIAKIGMRNSIPFAAVIPNPTYGGYYWGQKSLLGRNRLPEFNQLLDAADKVVYVCQSVYENGLHSNFIRNQAMVNMCDMALVYNPQSSGTRDAVSRLVNAHKPYDIYPFSGQGVLF